MGQYEEDKPMTMAELVEHRIKREEEEKENETERLRKKLKDRIEEIKKRDLKIEKKLIDNGDIIKDPPTPIKELGAIKHDDGKLRWDLLPYDALEEVVKAYTKGCEEYGDRNWEKGFPYSTLFAALMRHLTAWWNGEDLNDSGYNHLAHVIFNAFALLTFQLRGKGKDNRVKREVLEKESLL